MAPDPATGDWLAPFLGEVVVADLAEYFVVVGTLSRLTGDSAVFTDADLHDHRESASTKEVYVLESQKYGVRINRREVAVPRRQIVAVSRIADVVG